MSFDDAKHLLTQSDDGSFTAYSKEYAEHYHSTKDGALHESLKKHIEPAYLHVKSKNEVNILDICYGLGINTLATILHYRKFSPKTRLNIYSPELDAELVSALQNFQYPQGFELLREVIDAISRDGVYDDELLHVEVFLGDAREYVREFENFFDIVYQDAFSPAVNPALWTQEYFADVAKAMRKDGILTSYSTALKTRLALHVNGFHIYLHEGKDFRSSTLASRELLDGYKQIDMQHKIVCNPDAKPLRDAEI